MSKHIHLFAKRIYLIKNLIVGRKLLKYVTMKDNKNAFNKLQG